MTIDYTQAVLPQGNIDPRVYNAYAPQWQQAVQTLAENKNAARSDVFSQLAKRGMLTSGLLPSALSSLDLNSQRALGGLYADISSKMAEQNLSLQEAQRQEKATQDWGLMNMALKMLSPLVGTPIAGLSYQLGQSFLPKYDLRQLYNGAQFASPNSTYPQFNYNNMFGATGSPIGNGLTDTSGNPVNPAGYAGEYNVPSYDWWNNNQQAGG